MNNPSSNASVTMRLRIVKILFSMPMHVSTLLLSLLLSGMTLITSASAATITVGNAGDHPVGNAANCDVASTCTLRDAIAKAANVTGTATGDTIVFTLPANSTITLSGNELFLDRDLTIDGSAGSNVAVSGDGRSRVINISENAAITMNHIIIKNGHNDTYGAGISNKGLLMLVNCKVFENESYSAAGISNVGTATLIDTEVSNNLSSGSYTIGGGGIYNISGSMLIINSTLSNNSAQGDFGGGGAILNNGYLTVNDSSIFGNKSNGPGGAIFNYERGILSLTDDIISNNIGDQAGGLQNDGFASLKRTSIVDNSSHSGGGIVNTQFGVAVIVDSKIVRNITTEAIGGSSVGGGVYNYYGTLTISRSEISRNSSYDDGGGIFNFGVTSISNVTIANNVAGRTGGIRDIGLLHIINGTIADNVDTSGAESNASFYGSSSSSVINTIIQSCRKTGGARLALVDGGGNLDGGIDCGLTNAGSKSNAILDLGALADNGGSTSTMLPGAHSDAIGRGLPSVCKEDPVSGEDQRGYLRSPIICTSGAVDPNATPSINLNQHSLSGSWADPTTNSQGFVMDIEPDFYGAGTGLLFAGWYTFDVTAAGGQRWYTLQAQVSGTTPTSAGIYSTTGGRFDSAQTANATQVGHATLSFSDCMHGTLDYAFTDGSNRAGSIPLTRLLSNTTCTPTGDSGTAKVPTMLSGAWADPGNSGQGLVFDMNANDNVIFAGWYTFSATGTTGSGAAAQRWYTLQATFKPGTITPNGVGIYESTGGAFNAEGSTQIKKVGSATLVFNTCTSATLTYTFTSGANSGKSGTLDLVRLTPAPSSCHL